MPDDEVCRFCADLRCRYLNIALRLCFDDENMFKEVCLCSDTFKMSNKLCLFSTRKLDFDLTPELLSFPFIIFSIHFPSV